ncbi:MAG: chloride channel protein [Kofleriaceae bacterium]
MLKAGTSLGRMILLAIVVGVFGAGTAIAVRGALTHGLAWIYDAPDVVTGVSSIPGWMRIFAPVLGGLIAGALTMTLLRRGSPAVADVMEAVALGRGRPRLGRAAVQAAASIAASLGGGSIGREGPLIQLGAGVGHEIGSRATDSARSRRALVAAGTAAGFAAAYNTPIAAVLFVLEVLVGMFTLDVLIPVLVATAVGTAVTRAVIGGGPIYGARAFALISSAEFVAYGVLGVLCAVGGVLFMKLLGAGERTVQRLQLPRVATAGLGGLIVGLMIWQLPEVAGNGYEPLRAILDGHFAIHALLILGLAKAFASTVSVASGSPGGVFTPNMLIGATIGGACGQVVALIAPEAGVVPGGYALVGMAAAVAATTHAPLMATALAFELSGDYEIVLPLLLATGVATLLSRQLQRDSIYTAELRRRGIPWEGTLAERLARAARARDLMEPDPPIVPASEPLSSSLVRMADSRGRLLYVVDGGPVRAISLTTAKQHWAACMRGEPVPNVTAGELAAPIATVRPDDTLLEIGEKLWAVDWGELPVVDPAHPTKPLGTVTRRGLLGAFDRELLQRDVLVTRVASLQDDGNLHVNYLELPDGHRVALIPLPASLVGGGLDVGALRKELGVIIVAIRRDRGGDASPSWLDPDHTAALAPGDRLMVIATAAELARFQTPS